jgi:hypothetical protein
MRTRSQRRRELKQYHGFICQCWICTQGKEKVANSDAMRLQIGGLVSKVLEEHRRGGDADFKQLNSDIEQMHWALAKERLMESVLP